jgi:hypothetical protein
MSSTVRKIRAERAWQYARNNDRFTQAFVQKAGRQGVSVWASPRAVGNLFKDLFFIGLHCDVLTDFVAGDKVGDIR